MRVVVDDDTHDLPMVKNYIDLRTLPNAETLGEALKQWKKLRIQAWEAYFTAGGGIRTDLRKPPWDRP